jgi:hypothetical protein
MRAKALVLGATPPVVGPWVRISDASAWESSVEARPVSVKLNGQIRLEVESPRGTRFVGLGEVLTGWSVRAHVGEIEGLSFITILVEAQGGS